MADQQVSTAGAILDAAAVQAFRASVRGPVLQPGDDGYDSVRRVWNGMIDRRPALIIRCVGASDVIAAVNFARAQNLVVSVRGGGHSFPGHSVCDGGLMMDMSLMKGVRVDPAQRRVRAEPGLLWGDLDRETQAFGLAVTGGQISHTGIAGLTLGGGLGWLMRKHGLTCDNLLSVDLVTADGRLLTASASENPDLFWGVRGGGGNFGVVTSYEYQLHPLGPVLGGLIAYPLPEAPAVLRAYREYMRQAPDELTTVAAFLTSPDGHPAVGIAVCYAGDLETGAKLVQPMRSFGTVVMDQIGPMPYAVVQSMLDDAAVPGRRFYMRSNFMNDLSDGAIAIITEYYARTPSPLSAVVVIQMGGAVSRVEREATAFYHRDAAYSLSILGGWLDPLGDDENVTWARDLWEALQPHAASGVYVNELGAGESEERIKAAYGGSTFARLTALKNKYDPANFFRLNQNIRPTV